MRILDAGFAAHLATGATTLCTCWRIERRDGVVLGFTDHDEAVPFAGCAFEPGQGLDGGEVAQKLGAQVDTGEVLGVLSGAAISEDDIALGRYRGGEVQTWLVNWRDVSERALLRRDTIGEIVREDGVFRAELRSGQAALNVPKGRIYQALCDARLGDNRCRVNLDQPAFRAAASVTAIKDRHRLAVDGLSGFAPGWFGFGSVRWTGGKRLGLTDDVLTHARIGAEDILSFEEPVGDWLEVGDSLIAYAGCDRRLATCREKFGNVVNFRGFPHIPGNDFVLRYPKSGDRLDGSALWL